MTRAEPGRAALAACLAGLALLAGCDGGSADTGGPGPSSPMSAGESSSLPAPPAPAAYVALGDSYTAAPFVPTTDVAGGCFRSSGNYPALVAEALDPGRFRDVSCGGADSGDLVGPQQVGDGEGTVPPQIRAVRRTADLVTVGIGGNDGGLFTRLACGFVEQPFPLCDLASPGDVGSTLERTRADVSAALEAIVRRAAPGALVLLVGYPRLVDPSTSCPALPIEGARAAEVQRVEQQLRATLRGAARDAGVEFLDLWGPSRGHEVCSDDPWVNGGETDQSRALAYHPFAAEQEAVAELVVQRWSEHEAGS